MERKSMNSEPTAMKLSQRMPRIILYSAISLSFRTSSEQKALMSQHAEKECLIRYSGVQHEASHVSVQP